MSKIDVTKWINRSSEHLKLAKIAFKEGLFNDAVFHSHQAIEMVLKASWLYFLRRTPPSRGTGHDLFALYPRSLRKHIKLTKRQVEFLIDLTPHYLNSRYPELLWLATKSYAQKALKNAEKLVECFVKKLSSEQ